VAEAQRCLNCGLICYQHAGNDHASLTELRETVNA